MTTVQKAVARYENLGAAMVMSRWQHARHVLALGAARLLPRRVLYWAVILAADRAEGPLTTEAVARAQTVTQLLAGLR